MRWVHLGVVAYVWGPAGQDRLLTQCLAPAAAELRRRGVARRFWFDRYDARGPHIFALFTLPKQDWEATADALTSALARLLAEAPSTAALSPRHLARLDAETRGRRQCEPDGRPGVGANNSFELFEHPERGYPFFLSAGLVGEDELWDLTADLSLWTIARLGAQPGAPATAAALRWTASVDSELRLAGAHPADYWRYHASTLLPVLDGAGPEEETAALSTLAAGVGDTNPAFAQAWAEVAAAGSAWPGLSRLVRLGLGAGSGMASPSPWALLRELDHVTLKQLGLPVAFHLPLVLYAWRQSAANAANG